MVFAAIMSETGDVIVDKDNSNNMGNFDAFDDPLEDPLSYILKSFESVVVILLEKELFKIYLLVPVLCPRWVDLSFIELVVLRMLYLCL